MPWDRENKQHVLDDSRAYDVGLSDDAGGGNPLGFAMKVGHAPVQEEVTRLDDYIKWTLYGVKPDTAKPPLKSLQIRYDDPTDPEGHDADGIRMTMYYYDDSGHPSSNWSGHFAYDYKEVSKCSHYGIEGGPNWCMSESLSNATYRAFNFPHHCASYYNMYRVSRYHDAISTYHPWSWYLARAANTTIKFGAPSVGVMDGTLFREVLRSLQEEASAAQQAADSGDYSETGGAQYASQWSTMANTISDNMLTRAIGFGAKEYPYGSEFAFDTTGQEEVVVWLTHFANSTNRFLDAAKRTVDFTLSHMRSSPTWAYHGGSRSWGDLGNNGKWMPTVGTRANFETRGNFHYRSGLNSIPLIEWYRANPDDHFLLEVSLGANAGQLTNIDEAGAPSMMLHMLPHILDFDPHSGDYGLGFFGHTLEAGAYLVTKPNSFVAASPPSSSSSTSPASAASASATTTTTTKMAATNTSATDAELLCYFCDLTSTSTSGAITFVPRDSYRIRLYLEPLGLYLQADAGTFASFDLDLAARTLAVHFTSDAPATASMWRLRVDKVAASRPGSNFQVNGAKHVRGAYELPSNQSTFAVSWSAAA
jgi:hypothetical protein